MSHTAGLMVNTMSSILHHVDRPLVLDKVVVDRMNIKQRLKSRYIHLKDGLKTLAKFIYNQISEAFKGLTPSPSRPFS